MMFSKEKVQDLIDKLIDETGNASKDNTIIKKIEEMLNFLREKEVREEIERRWEELEKQESQTYISDVHEYTESIGSLKIESIKKTQNGLELSFSGKAGGLTEFGTELTYNIAGILTLGKNGTLGNVKWTKRELIETKSFGMD
ncbi:MAG: hypothetical protein EAX91_16745 [Candidatus Lokiarchaeota archaeon]|nr:hypothetical protein [Candidatus Lokiarchaeota archaeon]